MTIEYVGIVEGLHTWHVFDSVGRLVGKNQSDVVPDNEAAVM